MLHSNRAEHSVQEHEDTQDNEATISRAEVSHSKLPLTLP